MEQLIEFSIPFKGLDEGSHYYDFKVNKTFFRSFEASEVNDGDIDVKLELIKRSSFLQLNFQVLGTVNVMCDRCLDNYNQAIENKFSMFVKFDNDEYEEGDDVIQLSVDDHHLDIAQYIYEYILLSIPIQRAHPDDGSGQSTCNPQMLEKLNEHIIRDEEPTDSRWDELKKLLGN